MSGKKIPSADFKALAPTLRKKLIEGIKKEREDCALPDVGGAASDLYSDLPAVDSKTVAKMSPLVKDLIGRRLDPRWIRKGGYLTPEEAADDILAKIRENCVAPMSPTPVAAGEKPLPTT